ncbi:MAG TPA: hypothetical protein VKW04_18460 [Planctomycetota bacterium]|nr:hypothetical protein [Planctomycetota bacterium]
MLPRTLAGLILCLAAGVGAQGCRTVVVEGHWEELGRLSADLSLDHGILELRGEGRFWAVKIEAAGADLEMYDLRMTFGNGEVYDPSVRLHFQEGSWSRRIDLPGGHRHLRKIEFWYKATQPGPGQASIVVWGLH